MTRRQSIYVDDFPHANPVPAACRIDNMVYSGVIYGRDPATQEVPADMDQQCQLMFAHVRTIIEAAGGSLDDIIKINLSLRDKAHRPKVNPHWEALFPDPATRPARQGYEIAMSGNIQVQCDFIAVLPDQPN